MSSKGGKDGRCLGLTTLPPSYTDWKSRCFNKSAGWTLHNVNMAHASKETDKVPDVELNTRLLFNG